MSWFTAANTTSPVCPRCKTSASAALVKRSGEYFVFDCRRCGPIPQKAKS